MNNSVFIKMVKNCFGAAGMVALSGSICNVGYSFVIRRKFSTSNFWKDCVTSGATITLYIGEVCHVYFKKSIYSMVIIWYYKIRSRCSYSFLTYLRSTHFLDVYSHPTLKVCRYLLASEECIDEKNHKIRLMFGNGLRPQIWTNFVSRFRIPNIVESYASTEGNRIFFIVWFRIYSIRYYSYKKT